MSSYRKVRLSIKPWRDHFLVVPPSLRCAPSLFSITLLSLFFCYNFFFIMLLFYSLYYWDAGIGASHLQ